MAATDVLTLTDSGLYCPAGDFHIDPWKPVDRAIITHAHGDHARWGSRRYLTTHDGSGVLRRRMAPDARIRSVAWGERVDVNGVRASLHPAGHILGSAQVRVEHGGRVWVVSGDYKTEADMTCAPFEPVRCDVFITESTFGLPIYRWRPQHEVFAEINDWWRGNAAAGVTSVLFAYALGKAQRLLAGVDASIGPILVHGAVATLNEEYRAAGVALPDAEYATAAVIAERRAGALVVAPPSALASPWLRRFDPVSTAFASGWMRVRGMRRRRAIDRGFVVSDHADWDGLRAAIDATGAERVWATHGYTAPLVRWLREARGLDAHAVATRFEGEGAEAEAAAEAEAGAAAESGAEAEGRPGGAAGAET
jgi:putative mRNA 3-end processing factor